jgi:hypothetical protein
MKRFIEEIKKASAYEVIGYSDSEIEQIEHLYDICIKDEFKCFLKEAGRSCGCNLKNGYTKTEIIIDLYCSVDVRQQVISQYVKRETLLNVAFQELKNEKGSDLKKHRLYKWISGKPYFLSLENQTQHFLILTEERGAYPVYRYDENSDEMSSINCGLVDYLRYVIDLDFQRNQNSRKWIGEMLTP